MAKLSQVINYFVVISMVGLLLLWSFLALSAIFWTSLFLIPTIIIINLSKTKTPKIRLTVSIGLVIFSMFNPLFLMLVSGFL